MPVVWKSVPVSEVRWAMKMDKLLLYNRLSLTKDVLASRQYTLDKDHWYNCATLSQMLEHTFFIPKHAKTKFDEKRFCLNLFCMFFEKASDTWKNSTDEQWSKSTVERKQITQWRRTLATIVSTNKRISLRLFFSEPAAVVFILSEKFCLQFDDFSWPKLVHM